MPPANVITYMTAKTPEGIAEITGADVEELKGAFEAVRILRPDDD